MHELMRTRLVLVGMLCLAGCSGRDAVVVERSFLRACPEHATDQDLAGRYAALRYLAESGDADAVLVVMKFVSSDARQEDIATSECPFHSTEDLAVAAYHGGADGLFWDCLPRFSAPRQARLIAHYTYLHGRTDSHGAAIHSMVDFEGDRDAYLASHPTTLAELRRWTRERRSSDPGR
jgi:hypothetical protein